MSSPDAPDPWILDPAFFPRRLELDLPEPLLEKLQQLAERSGRDLEEVALSLLDQQLSLQADEPPV